MRQVEVGLLGIHQRAALVRHPPKVLHNLRSIKVHRAVAGKHRLDCIQALDGALGVVPWFGDLVDAPTFCAAPYYYVATVAS